MQHGEQIKCQNCGKDAFAIKKILMDGWINLGEVLACSACDAKVADIADFNSSDEKGLFAKSALSDLLGIEEEEKKELKASEEEKHFCRDCCHYIEHPFLTRCSFFDKTVSPMDDCPEFTKIEEKN